VDHQILHTIAVPASDQELARQLLNASP